MPRPPCLSQTPFLQTHLTAVVGLGHQQHAAHEVCGGHTLRAFALSGAEVRWRFSSQTLLRLCYRRNPPEGHDPNPVPPQQKTRLGQSNGLDQ